MARSGKIVDGVGRRRGWSDEEKLRFVAEATEPGASVSAVARRHDLRPGQIFTWRRMAEGRAAGSAPMLPVVVSEPVAPPPVPRGRPPRAARVEIGLPGGIKLKVDAGVDPAALAVIIGTQQRR